MTGLTLGENEVVVLIRKQLAGRHGRFQGNTNRDAITII